MVLQQAPAKSAVYGTVVGSSTAKISVTVTPAGADAVAYTTSAAVTLTADGNSTWKAYLKPTPAGGNYTISAKCTSGCSGEAHIADVTFGVYACVCGRSVFGNRLTRLVPLWVRVPCALICLFAGDVWYCSGQSNMALPVLHTFSRNKSRDLVQSGKGPDIRIHGLRGNMNKDQVWSTAAAACEGDTCSDLFSFSSTCWYFAESLAEKLQPARPIGLVHTAWGGSQIEQ